MYRHRLIYTIIRQIALGEQLVGTTTPICLAQSYNVCLCLTRGRLVTNGSTPGGLSIKTNVVDYFKSKLHHSSSAIRCIIICNKYPHFHYGPYTLLVYILRGRVVFSLCCQYFNTTTIICKVVQLDQRHATARGPVRMLGEGCIRLWLHRRPPHRKH